MRRNGRTVWFSSLARPALPSTLCRSDVLGFEHRHLDGAALALSSSTRRQARGGAGLSRAARRRRASVERWAESFLQRPQPRLVGPPLFDALVKIGRRTCSALGVITARLVSWNLRQASSKARPQ